MFAVDGLTVIVSETAAPLYPSLVTSVEMVIADGVKTCGEIYVAVKSPLEFVAHDTGLSSMVIPALNEGISKTCIGIPYTNSLSFPCVPGSIAFRCIC